MWVHVIHPPCRFGNKKSIFLFSRLEGKGAEIRVPDRFSNKLSKIVSFCKHILNHFPRKVERPRYLMTLLARKR